MKPSEEILLAKSVILDWHTGKRSTAEVVNLIPVLDRIALQTAKLEISAEKLADGILNQGKK